MTTSSPRSFLFAVGFSVSTLALAQYAGPTPGAGQPPAPAPTAAGSSNPGTRRIGVMTSIRPKSRPQEERSGPPPAAGQPAGVAHPANVNSHALAPGAAAHATALTMPPSWEHIEGCAKDISIARPGVVFVLGCEEQVVNGVSVGHPLFRWSGGEWWKQPSVTGIRVIALAAGLDGNQSDFMYMVIDPNEHLTFFWRVPEFPNGPQRVLDAGTGYGKTYVLGAPEERGYDGPLYRAMGIIQDHGDMMDGSSNSGGHYPELCKENISGVRVASSPAGSAWILKHSGMITELQMPAFQQMRDHCGTLYRRKGCARAVAVGADNRPWILGCEERPDGNHAVLRYNGGNRNGEGTFDAIDGWGVAIAVDPANNLPWIITKDGSIYRYKGR